MTDSVTSELPNLKLATSNVTTRKDDEIDKKVEKFNVRPSKFC